MNRNKRVLVTFFMVLTALFTESAVAKLQKDARECIKPRFSKFTPPKLTEVAPGSTVSFVTNYTTGKATIKVTVKGIAIKDLRVTDKNSFYLVEFELPEELVDTFARLHIRANAKTGSNACKHRDGWLLKIAGNPKTEATKATTEKSETAATSTETPAAEP